jgi:hypothetical protein
MKYSDEILMAYADGELDAQTRAEIEAAAATDPQLAAAITRHRATRELLRQGFDGILDEPVPSRLLDALEPRDSTRRPTAEVTPLPERSRRWSWPEWGAMAATLLLGALIGAALRTAPAPILERHADRLFAAGQLSDALSTQLAQDFAPGDEIRPGLSFRTVAGDYCRTFAIGRTAGLACRDPDRWRVEMLATLPEPEIEGYRLAGVELPGVILEAVEAQIEGDPLDAAEESAARERGWRD